MYFIWALSGFRWKFTQAQFTPPLPEVELKHMLFATYSILIRAIVIPKYLKTDKSWVLTKQNRCKTMIWSYLCLPGKDHFCPVSRPKLIIPVVQGFVIDSSGEIQSAVKGVA